MILFGWLFNWIDLQGEFKVKGLELIRVYVRLPQWPWGSRINLRYIDCYRVNKSRIKCDKRIERLRTKSLFVYICICWGNVNVVWNERSNLEFPVGIKKKWLSSRQPTLLTLNLIPWKHNAKVSIILNAAKLCYKTYSILTLFMIWCLFEL